MKQIEALHKDIMDACRLYVDNLTKPLGSLGRMEDMAVRLAGIFGEVKPSSLPKAVVIFCGDTDVDGEKNETKGFKSYNEAALVAQGYGPVNAAARQIGAAVYVIDVGLEKESAGIPGVLVQKAVRGTHCGNPAMTPEAAARAIQVGMSVATTLAGQGVRAAGLGNIGERSMLSALAVTAAILKDDLTAASEKQGLRLHLASLGDFATDPCGVLAQVGSAEIAALFGFIVQAAREGMAVVFDNAVTGAAALGAVTAYPEIRDYLFPSAVYDEPVHQMQLSKLGMEGYLHYHFTEGEGFGSVLGLSLLDASLCMLNLMATFCSGGVDVAEDGPGKGRQREDVK
jgi:putative nicotinate-nucleotide--dimethylbenzimidazole phosphoribosyltransferase